MNKMFFCNMCYFATGEGMTVAIAAIIAANEEEAVRRLLKRTICRDLKDEDFERGFEYFKCGVEVFDLRSEGAFERAKKISQPYICGEQFDFILKAEKEGALHDFLYTSYVNFS